MNRIQLTAGNVSLTIDLLATETANAIAKHLPFDSITQTWGNEIYFKTPVNCALEKNARDIVEAGEIAFWVEGQCIAIGFGPTPISQGNEIRLAARTNIWGKTTEDVTALASVKAGDPIHIKLLAE